MYTVKVDGYTIHDPRTKEYNLTYAKADLELNKTGSFEFDITEENPGYGYINPMKSVVSVYDNAELIFQGRSITSESDFYNTGTMKCEGELALLMDSVLRPRTTGFVNQTNVQVFTEAVNEHNSQMPENKQFQVGTIDVDEVTIAQIAFAHEYTLNFIQSNLVETYGGYLRVRWEGGTRYIDWVKQYGKTSRQPIQFGRNLLDLKKITTSSDVCTVCIPLGGSDRKVTIKNAEGHDGTDSIRNEEAIGYYGEIVKVVEFPEINDPNTLYTEGQKWFEENMKSSITVELTAVDLRLAGVDIDSLGLGDLVEVDSKPHKIVYRLDDRPAIAKYSYDLLNPENNTITIGKTMKGFTERDDSDLEDRVEEAEKAAGEATEKADLAENAANEANQAAQNAQEKADIAEQASQNAVNQATEANQAAQNAQNLAAEAQTKADAANKDIATIKTETENIREDAAALRTELQGQIDTVTETMEASYAKKTDVSTTEATLRAEWKKSAAEIQSTMESDYAKKTELTAVQADLQTQVTQNATNITTTASAVENVKIDADNAVKNATEAKEAAANAQTAANNAVSTANTAQTSADVAAQAAADAQVEATKAQTAADTAAKAAADADAIAQAAQKDLDEAKANLDAVTNRVGSTEEEIAAAQAAVNTAQAEADRANQAAQNAQSAATTAQNTADQAKTDAQSAQAAASEAKTNAENAKATADAAQVAADKANTDLGNLANRVTEMSTKIDQNAEAISLAATKTEVTEKLTGYSTKEETQAAIQLQADSVRTEVSNTFINLGMEGRNYIRNTKLMEGYSKGGTASIAVGEDGIAVASFAPTALSWGQQVITKPPIQFSLIRNKKVTFTIWAKSEDYEAYNADATHGLMVSFALCTADDETRTKYHDQNFFATQLSSEWKKLTFTTTLSDAWFGSGTGTIDDTTRFLLQIFDYSVYKLDFKQLKLEIGDTATNYSEAPEDVDGAIVNLKASLELKVDTDKLVSELNASADVIHLSGNRFIVDADNYSLTADGNMTANAGKVAGWDINRNRLYTEYTNSFSFTGNEADATDAKVDISLWSVPTGIMLETVSLSDTGLGVGGKLYAIRTLEFALNREDLALTPKGINTIGIGENGNAIIHNGNVGNYLSIGDTFDIYGDTNVYGRLKTRYSIAPINTEKFACGLSDARWSTVYTKGLDATGEVWMYGVADPSFQTVQTYAANMYIGSSGRVWKRSSTSSRYVKHDIADLEDWNINAQNLLNVDVIQYRYNNDVIDKNDQRYGQLLPGFVIEDLMQKYPVCVDQVGESSREYSWNTQYLLPGMLKLDQLNHTDITEVRSIADRNTSRIESLDYMLQQAFLKIAEQEKLIKQLQASS